MKAVLAVSCRLSSDWQSSSHANSAQDVSTSACARQTVASKILPCHSRWVGLKWALFFFRLSPLRLWCSSTQLGPLHTRAKSRDHEIVRAQKESVRRLSVPRHLRSHVVWSRILECGVKPYVTGSSSKCYFKEFLFMWVFTHDTIE